MSITGSTHYLNIRTEIHFDQASGAPPAEVNSESNGCSINILLPTCWTTNQAEEFRKKYDWLIIQDRKLGCTNCRQAGSNQYESALKIAHVQPAPQWVDINIKKNGLTKIKQQASLRKKLNEHEHSRAHQKIVELIKKIEAKEFALDEIAANMQKDSQKATERIFRTVYNLAIKCRPFTDLPSDIDVQI
ncbi:hypothetical protein RN001_008877 [Aquatica leii]|uniref:Uncharacterized protein n=1 Tax=Aquatica leii TaxID=1421715 RepID=A0AAN7PHU3_9COLE|nr:hypothetical protein RN001_008877 [Aquatica leii]